MLDRLWLRFCETAQRVLEEERGDSMVNWIVLAVGLAVAAAAIVALLRPALETAAHKIVGILGG